MNAPDARAGEAMLLAPTETDQVVAWRRGPSLPGLRPSSLPELMADCLRRFPDVPVLCEGGRQATWRDLDAWSGRLAASWAPHLPAGARCAILMPNGLAHLLAELACWRLGAVAAPLFLGFGPQRLGELLQRLQPRLALVDDAGAAGALPAGCRRLGSAEVWSTISRPQGGAGERAVAAGDPCLIQFTSGSTGLPRGVVLTQDNLASQQAAFALHWPEIGPGDRLAAYLPWHHSFGGLAERLWSLCRGATLTVVPGGGRDRQRLLATIRAVAPTVFLSVPKIHALMAAEEVFASGSLRWAFTAGAPLPADLRRWYGERRIPLCEGWGLTETSPSCTLTRPGHDDEGVVGWPIAGVEVGVRRADGHILVRGANVMAGYLGESATPTLQGGILDTGDLGEWTAHGLRLRGRADHQLKLGNGEKACAADLEAGLQGEPAIHHAVVAAEPELIAIVEPRDGCSAGDAHAAAVALNARQDIPCLRLTALYAATTRMTVENGRLTASLKVSRGQVLADFRRWRQQGGTEFVRCPPL